MEKDGKFINKWLSEIITMSIIILNIVYSLMFFLLTIFVYTAKFVDGNLDIGFLYLLFCVFIVTSITVWYFLYNKVLTFVYARQLFDQFKM